MTKYYSEDFAPEGRGLRIFIGIVISLCSLLVGGAMGFEVRDKIQRDHEEQAKYRARPTVQNPPPNLIPCNDPLKSRELVNQICRARMRSTAVGAK